MNAWLDERTAHILAVDDQPENLRILTELLSPSCVVHPFPDGASLLRYLDRGKSADLIMLDIVMPGADGYDICGQIRTRPALRDVPVVFLTSLDSESDEARGLSLGAVDFITKPFSPLIVLARVRNHVRLGRATRVIQQQNDILEAKVEERTRELRAKVTELRQVTQTLSTILEASPVGIVTLDRTGTILTCNPAAATIFARPLTEILGIPFPMPADDHPTPAWGLDRLAAGDLIRGSERNWHRPDGSTVVIRESAAPLLDDSGDFQGAVVALEDVSARKSVEDQLRHAQKMDAVGRLTSGIAHDFNNLLTIVIGNLDLLDERLPEGSPLRDFVQDALMGSMRGADMTRQLLAFCRQQTLEPKRVDLNRLVRTMVKLLSRTLGETIQIMLVEGEELGPVLVDPVQLDAAILNLAVNARDAMPNGGKLTFSTGNRTLTERLSDGRVELAAGPYAVIEVSDTGAGMPPDVVSRIFEPFFTTKPVNKGSGLGLAMVYGFLKQSGGSVTVYSEVGHGTTFRLYLPHATETDKAIRPAPTAEAPSTGPGGETILVVEDNAFVRKVVVHQLKTLGYAVLTAENAARALDILGRGTPVHLVFSDVIMPGNMTGIELAREIRRRWPALKIVLSTGFSEDALLRDGNAVSSLILTKPYRQSDLSRKLRQALDGERGRDAHY